MKAIIIICISVIVIIFEIAAYYMLAYHYIISIILLCVCSAIVVPLGNRISLWKYIEDFLYDEDEDDNK